MLYTRTFGVMPTREEFDRCWQQTMNSETTFSFGNDSRVGNCELTQEELWKELLQAKEDWDLLEEDETSPSPSETGDWLSCVLGVLGFEWV
jgi:hypothetical protein